MIELDKILYNLVKPMVSNSNSLEVRKMESLNENEVILYVYASSEDISRLIGRKGSMSDALKRMMSVASHLENKKISIKFESL